MREREREREDERKGGEGRTGTRKGEDKCTRKRGRNIKHKRRKTMRYVGRSGEEGSEGRREGAKEEGEEA